MALVAAGLEVVNIFNKGKFRFTLADMTTFEDRRSDGRVEICLFADEGDLASLVEGPPINSREAKMWRL